MKIFKDNMEAIQNTVDIENLPAYRRLLTEEYWKIPDDQFQDVIDEILKNVKEGVIKLIDIVKIYAYFSYFVKKDLIAYNMRELEKIFIEGMNKAWLKSKYCDTVEEELGKIALDEIVDDMSEILEHFNNLNQRLLEKQYMELADEVFKCIPMKMELFYEKFDKKCMDIPVFKYYDPYQIFQRISCGSNEDIVRIKEKLMIRIDKTDKEILKPEIHNLMTLKKIIEDYIFGKSPTIKLVMLADFANELGSILEKLCVHDVYGEGNMESQDVIIQSEYIENPQMPNEYNK